MARAATTSDVFNAVAEEKRRDILGALLAGAASVGELVDQLDMDQPQVSKHLKVLREVDLVDYRSEGRNRIYRIKGEGLRPVHEWVIDFARLWTERLDRLDEYLVDLKEGERE